MLFSKRLLYKSYHPQISQYDFFIPLTATGLRILAKIPTITRPVATPVKTCVLQEVWFASYRGPGCMALSPGHGNSDTPLLGAGVNYLLSLFLSLTPTFCLRNQESEFHHHSGPVYKIPSISPQQQ